MKLRKHILYQESCKNLYHTWRIKSIQSKEESLCVIHNKMDHVKIVISRLQMCNKMISRLGQLPTTLIGMTTHGHEDETYVPYLNELWPNDPNFIIGSLLWFFCTLEVALVVESKLLFEEPHVIHSMLIFCKGNCIVYMNYACWKKIFAQAFLENIVTPNG